MSHEGWAIDENTMLEISENKIEIFGAGNAYQIKRQNGGIIIKIHQSAV
jgi:hypothetical protein